MGKKSKSKFRPISVKEEKEMENAEMEKELNVSVEPEVVVEGQPIVQEGLGVVTPEVSENSDENSEETVQTEQEPVDSADEAIDPITKVNGKLSGCAKLYVRKEASKESEAIAVITDEDVVVIDLVETTDEFYKVEFNDISGYCVKKFIQEITE